MYGVYTLFLTWEITKYAVIYDVGIRFWPTLKMVPAGNSPCFINSLPTLFCFVTCREPSLFHCSVTFVISLPAGNSPPPLFRRSSTKRPPAP